MSQISSLLEQAISCFKNEDFTNAKRYVEKILKQEPDNFDALHLSGVLFGSEGRHKKASEYFKRCIIINPKNASLHFNLANSFSKMGNYKEANNYFIEASKLVPQNFHFLLNHAINCFKLGSYDESLLLLNKAYSLEQNSSELFFYIAINKYKKKEFKESADFINKSINLNNVNPDAWHQRGEIYLEIKNFREALISFQNAEKLNYKGKIDLYNNIIFSIIMLNDDWESFKFKDTQNKLDEAINYAEKVISIDKNNYAAIVNLGLCNLYKFKIDQSISYLKKALKQFPNSVNTLANLGLAYRYNAEYKISENYYNKACLINPKDNDIRATLGEVQLCQNNFKEGWSNYDYRKWNLAKIQSYNFSKPLWRPNLGFGKLLIWGEQGIGDRILFGTILHKIQHKFEKIILLTEKRLIQLHKENFPSIDVFDQYDYEINEELFDFHISLSSLGKFFRLNENDFDEPKMLNVENRIFNSKLNRSLRCGISWASYSPTGKNKSVKLESLIKILKKPEVEFFNIQYSDEKSEVDELKIKHNVNISSVENLDVKNDIYGLMQFIKSCDFIITISNTTAHLSGSLGVPTYLLLSKGAGALWYWLNNKNNENMWYPSIKIFQQTTYKNWDDPVNEIINSLNKSS